MILNDNIIKWLLDGDISIQYQTYRDLLDTEKPDLKRKISKEGWAYRYLLLRKPDGHWGKGFYSPKWTSTHYTLLDLKNFNISQNIKEIKNSINVILRENKCGDGGVNPSKAITNSDVCINGMFLNYASYFNSAENDLNTVVDFLLSQKMTDGGFNCHSNRKGASHSSLHTTLSVIEGINEYFKNGFNYRTKELLQAESGCVEFILKHRLFKSHRTGTIIKNQFTQLSYPPRWYYDILRCLDHFYFAGLAYNDSMQDAIEILLKKRTKDGRWKLQTNHRGLVHFEMEKAGEPSRWNTLRALRVLKFYNING